MGHAAVHQFPVVRILILRCENYRKLFKTRSNYDLNNPWPLPILKRYGFYYFHAIKPLNLTDHKTHRARREAWVRVGLRSARTRPQALRLAPGGQCLADLSIPDRKRLFMSFFLAPVRASIGLPARCGDRRGNACSLRHGASPRPPGHPRRPGWPGPIGTRGGGFGSLEPFST